MELKKIETSEGVVYEAKTLSFIDREFNHINTCYICDLKNTDICNAMCEYDLCCFTDFWKICNEINNK